MYFGNSVSMTKYLAPSERRTVGPEELILASDPVAVGRWASAQKQTELGDAADVNVLSTERQYQIFIAI